MRRLEPGKCGKVSISKQVMGKNTVVYLCVHCVLKTAPLSCKTGRNKRKTRQCRHGTIWQEISISDLKPDPVEAQSEQVPALINELLEVQLVEATRPPSSSVAYAMLPASAEEIKAAEEQASVQGVQNGEPILIFFFSSPNLPYPIASSIGHLAATRAIPKRDHPRRNV